MYSINPHRIVHGKENFDQVSQDKAKGIVSKVQATSISLTEIVLDSLPGEKKLWKWGHEPRGGTPAVLVDTPLGLKYLSIFHSGGHYMIHWCITYFMGAYLFDPFPPFRITHFSRDPIIPNAMYNETNGWAYKSIDYIVFPMGLLAFDDVLFIISGRNDRSGWVIKINKKSFIESLAPVRSEVLMNNFKSYISNLLRV